MLHDEAPRTDTHGEKKDQLTNEMGNVRVHHAVGHEAAQLAVHAGAGSRRKGRRGALSSRVIRGHGRDGDIVRRIGVAVADG